MGQFGFQLNNVCYVRHEPSGQTGAPRMHFNEDLHLIHILGGQTFFQIGHNKRRLSKGHIVYVPPLTEFKIPALKCGLEMLNFHFGAYIDDGVPFDQKHSLPLVFSDKDFETIIRRLRKINHYWNVKTITAQARATSLACSLFSRYLKSQQLLPNTDVYDQAMSDLRTGLFKDKSNTFDAEHWAESVSLSVSQMNRRFRNSFGTSPKEYWQKCRLHRARKLLAKTDLPVSQVSRYCGIEDHNYFSRWFKRRGTISPREYRKMANKEFPV